MVCNNNIITSRVNEDIGFGGDGGRKRKNSLRIRGSQRRAYVRVAAAVYTDVYIMCVYNEYINIYDPVQRLTITEATIYKTCIYRYICRRVPRKSLVLQAVRAGMI